MQTSLVNRIAGSIIDAVERAGGPVTLAHITKVVGGFAERDPSMPSWTYEAGDDVLWDGMTAEGCEALRRTIRDGRVAVLPGSRSKYLLDGTYLHDKRWVPIELVCASAANISGCGRLFAVPDDVADEIMRHAEAEFPYQDWRRRQPSGV